FLSHGNGYSLQSSNGQCYTLRNLSDPETRYFRPNYVDRSSPLYKYSHQHAVIWLSPGSLHRSSVTGVCLSFGHITHTLLPVFCKSLRRGRKDLYAPLPLNQLQFQRSGRHGSYPHWYTLPRDGEPYAHNKLLYV